LECGLFTRTSAIVPRHRIQLVSVHESLLHRLFGCVSVRIETAGGTDEESIGRKWFVPLLPKTQVHWLLAQLRSGLNLEQAPWQQVAPKARRRMINKAVIVALLASGVIAAVAGLWGGLAVAILLPLGIWYAVAAARRLAYAVTGEGICFRSGVLTRRTSATFADKIQVLRVSESPFDRRWGMATFSVDTAGAGPADHKIAVRYLDQPTAHSLLRDLATMAEGSVFRW
jgi:putative membrane protein